LIEDRKTLTSYFRSRLTADGLRSDPRVDARQLNLLGRLYEEHKDERGIVIDLDVGSAMAIDLLVKNVDYEDEHIELACLAVNELPGRLDKLWDIYKAWIHSKVDAASIERLAAQPNG
jgi:predicted mannosyl-3-phosphoglycerate phosphatase (HAD superfamily)